MKKIIFLIVFLSHSTFAAVNLKMEESSGKTNFLAVGNPGFLKINGNAKGPNGKLILAEGKLNGSIEINLKDLDTGLELRNKHMKEKYLETQEFPTAKLRINEQSLPKDWSIANPKMKDAKIWGELEVHGVRKNVEINYSIDDKANLNANFEIKITDFKIAMPAFMGVTVADKVNVEIQSLLVSDQG